MKKKKQQILIINVMIFVVLTLCFWGLKKPNSINAKTIVEEINKIETIEIARLPEGDLTDYYKSEDSGKKAWVVYDKNELISVDNNQTTNLSEGTMKVGSAKVQVYTGTGNFDDNDNPGYDSSIDNNIVRSFDEITYRLSFSIQNTTDINYTEISYRVTCLMDNAYISSDKSNKPQTIGKIINGTYIDTPEGKSSQIIIPATVNYSGQVMTPITIGLDAAQNGTEITPKFKIEIISGKNAETGKIDSFNNEYTEDNLLSLRVPTTYVSSKPSVQVKLIQGVSGKNELINSKDEYEYGYDVATVVYLVALEGRDKDDFKGAMYPSDDIKYTIKTRGTYTDFTGVKSILSQDQYTNFSLVDYSVADIDRKNANWSKGDLGIVYSNFTTLEAPYGKAKEIFFTNISTTDLELRGVYDSGNYDVTDSLDVTNSAYSATDSLYMYNMKKKRLESPLDKSISSLEMILKWDIKKTFNLANAAEWQRVDMEIYIDEITYGDEIRSNNTNIIYPNTAGQLTSWYKNTPTIAVKASPGTIEYEDVNYINGSPGTQGLITENYGNVRLTKGEHILLTNYASSKSGTYSSLIKKSETIQMWDASVFEYDTSRQPIHDTYTLMNFSGSEQYGVAIDETKTPPFTMQMETTQALKVLYKWYNSATEAKLHGDISAVLYNANFDLNPKDWHPIYGNMMQIGSVTPVTVIGNSGSITPKGNPIVTLAAQSFMDRDGVRVGGTITDGGDTVNGSPINNVGTYKPTVFNSDGSMEYPMVYSNALGDSAYIIPFGITTETEVSQHSYDPGQDIGVLVRANLVGSNEQLYDSSLTITLPKGISYKPGSSQYSSGKSINEPTITTNADGTSTLVYTQSVDDLNNGMDIEFSCKSNIKELNFPNDSSSDQLIIGTVGQIWDRDDPSQKDNRDEYTRASSDNFNIKIAQSISIEKKVDKKSVEVGDDAEINPPNNLLTYTIAVDNFTLTPSNNVRILDVLPNNNDKRGTKINGTLTVKSIKLEEANSKVKVYISSKVFEPEVDPFDVDLNDFTEYVEGVTSVDELKNINSILVEHDQMDLGESTQLEIQVLPEGMSNGDVLKNTCKMDTNLRLPIETVPTTTKVYNRNIRGTAWKDQNKNGLIEEEETKYADLPVYLYQSVEEDGQETLKLVKNDLKGNMFIDSSGNSSIVTDSNGDYSFNNVNQGNYVIKFEIQDLIDQKKLKVTSKHVNTPDDDPINSKAEESNGNILDVNLPALSEMVTSGYPNNSYILEHQNIGVVSLGGVDIYKYEEGTAKDTNGDGQLSDDEKLSGDPLKDAEFTIYRKDNDELVATGQTFDDGHLYYDLDFGEYYLIETKAPAGYELIKDKIYFQVEDGVIKVFISNKKESVLPFTGADNMFKLLIIISLGLISVGILFYLIKLYSNRKNYTRL